MAIPGEPRAPPGGTGFEFILGIGRIRGSVLGFRKFTSSGYPACSPSRVSRGEPGPHPRPEPPDSQDSVVSPPHPSPLPRSVLVYALLVCISFKRCPISSLSHPGASVYHCSTQAWASLLLTKIKLSNDFCPLWPGPFWEEIAPIWAPET